MFRTLAIGMKGPGVSAMQSRLNAAVSGTPLAIDGIFWSKTERRVKQFQSENQLKVDGIVGPRTWEKLLANRPAPAPQLNAPYCDNTNPDHLDETDDLKAALPAEEPTPVTGGTPKMLLAFSVPSLASLPKLPKLPSLPKLRPLAGSPEEAIMKSVYGASIDSSTVFMSDKTGAGGRPFTIATPNTILGPSRQVMNLGTSPSHDTIIHELAHVWQSQHASDATRYMLNSVESQALAEASNRLLKVTTFSAYAYRPGLKFSEYGAEQIAEQVENGEAAIVTHVKSIAPGKVDPENDTGLKTPRIEDTSAAGVKI